MGMYRARQEGGIVAPSSTLQLYSALLYLTDFIHFNNATSLSISLTLGQDDCHLQPVAVDEIPTPLVSWPEQTTRVHPPSQQSKITHTQLCLKLT